MLLVTVLSTHPVWISAAPMRLHNLRVAYQAHVAVYIAESIFLNLHSIPKRVASCCVIVNALNAVEITTEYFWNNFGL